MEQWWMGCQRESGTPLGTELGHLTPTNTRATMPAWTRARPLQRPAAPHLGPPEALFQYCS